jgi:SWI/SNF-related matrix-associated actin-dependent regulator 1 of chromatin subfamily A
MAFSNIVKKHCPQCSKVAIEKSRLDLGTTKMITLECGHIIFDNNVISRESKSDIISLVKKFQLKPYQYKGVEFTEAANGRVLIADQQGLGKTIQALAFIKKHLIECSPIAIVSKTTIKRQWFYEICEWLGIENCLTQIIYSNKEKAMPGMRAYIVSWDMLKNDDIFSLVQPKTLILDEVQAIKNHLSARAKAAAKLSKNAEYIIALSGTPIKNNAGEYFTILNILQPTRFPEYNRYLRDYCDSYETQYGYKVGGLKNPDWFHSDTKDFIIRRTRAEVAPEIPEVDRQFFHADLDKKLVKAYSAAQDELEELYYQDEDENTMTSMIAIITKMRRITGISKVEPCVEYVTEFLLEEEKKKIVIFLHHHTVSALLEPALNTWLQEGGYGKVLNLNASLSGDQRADLVNKFRDDDTCRVMIASTLAAGEGLNLQFCDTAIMLERQWNPANEEQAEGRFARIGQLSNHIRVIYMLASATIDEYFTEIVEKKRAIVAATLDNTLIEWDQSSLVKELTSILVTKGRQKFKL